MVFDAAALVLPYISSFKQISQKKGAYYINFYCKSIYFKFAE
jgi:hypothetical protein